LNNFREDYYASREHFLELAEFSSGHVVRAINPALGPDKLELTTDFLRIGSEESEQALILVSGTHGAEGFAGAAIQCAWLANKLSLPVNVAVVMVHGLNAFGFAHLRRVNEDNVDLNRNFIDHEADHPTNEFYAQIGAAMAATSLGGPERELQDQELERIKKEMGKSQVLRAIGGQYDTPEGMFYGGRTATWSNHTLRTELPKLLPRLKRAAYIDIHTGLGPSGHGSLYCYHRRDTAEFVLARQWWGEEISASGTSTINHGKTGHGAMEALAPAQVICLTLEFGTLSFEEVLTALRDEHAAWWHSDKQPEASVKSKFKAAFRLEDREWERRVVSRGLEVLSQTLSGLALD